MLYRIWKKLVDAAYWYETHTVNRFGNWLVITVEEMSDDYCKRYIKERTDAFLLAKGITLAKEWSNNAFPRGGGSGH